MPINFSQSSQKCLGQTLQVYKAFTKCLPTITLVVSGGDSTPNCPYTLLVSTNNQLHQIEIPPRRRFTFTFDCVEEIGVKCADNRDSFCNINIQMFITSCISCCQRCDYKGYEDYKQ
ncbi:S-Ena type endospore appendage [Halobacillus yeomjeoni]|uniref:S-Ena type endospore appendage n=1 Tax=Halobacillus yeomjeoni TaxID=311194 RepID=UPI00384A7AF0